MGKSVFLLLAIVMIAVSLVNCNDKEEKNVQQIKEQAQMQKVLEEHSKTVGMGLTGRLANGYPGLVGSRGFPSVHAHVDGYKPRFKN